MRSPSLIDTLSGRSNAPSTDLDSDPFSTYSPPPATPSYSGSSYNTTTTSSSLYTSPSTGASRPIPKVTPRFASPPPTTTPAYQSPPAEDDYSYSSGSYGVDATSGDTYGSGSGSRYAYDADYSAPAPAAKQSICFDLLLMLSSFVIRHSSFIIRLYCL